MNKLTLALCAVIAITTTLALTTVETSVTQQAIAAGNSSSVGKDNPTQLPLSCSILGTFGQGVKLGTCSVKAGTWLDVKFGTCAVVTYDICHQLYHNYFSPNGEGTIWTY